MEYKLQIISFVIGLIGIYKLLIYQNIDRFHILTIINLLFIPPLVGLHDIGLKYGICFFTMANLFNYSLQKALQIKYLFLLLPIISILISLNQYYINDWIYDLNLFWQQLRKVILLEWFISFNVIINIRELSIY